MGMAVFGMTWQSVSIDMTEERGNEMTLEIVGFWLTLNCGSANMAAYFQLVDGFQFPWFRSEEPRRNDDGDKRREPVA